MRMLALVALAVVIPMSCSGDGTIIDDEPSDDVTDDVTDDIDDSDEPDPVQVDPRLEGWCQIDEADFSFFVTSMNALWAWSGDDISDWEGGLGGNFGGLEGADSICQNIAIATGNGDKTWRAFLSATDDGSGNPVHAIERIGTGPWHDANGRLVASGLDGLIADDRPDGDTQSTDDLPDECGVPLSLTGDSHDVVTGSDAEGRLYENSDDATCANWTSDSGSVGTGDGRNGPLRCGHSFPRASGGGGGGGRGGAGFASDHPLRGCGKGANLLQDGSGSGTCIGCTGGYGALYCFAE